MSHIQLIDSHCHLVNLPADWSTEGVVGLSVATSEADWCQNLAAVRMLGHGWYAASGVHPWYLHDAINWDSLESLLLSNPDMAIGEIGLDGARHDLLPMQIQLEAFEKQLSLAYRLNRLVSVHAVKDQDLCYKMVKQYQVSSVIVHGFMGSLQQARAWQEIGCYIGIGPRFFARGDKALSMLSQLNLSQLLIETDAPYVAGNASYAILCHILEAIAATLSLSANQVAERLAQNWMQLWHSQN